MVEHQENFYVIRGQGNASKDLITIDGKTWEVQPAPSPITSIIESFSMVKACNNEKQWLLIAFGGYTEIGINKNLYIYNFDKATWVVKEVMPLYLRAKHSAVIIETKMSSFGGVDVNYQRINSTCAFDINNFKWEVMECLNPPKVMY
jgi:hypothetical protein